jgi:hypothetical protein
MNDPDARLSFADFLDRLALGQASPEEWQSLAVEHYRDEVLEDVRRRCVLLAISSSIWGDWSASEREGFQALASELRHPATR